MQQLLNLYLSLQVLENTIQLTLVKSLQMTLMALFEDCGFEEMAKPMLSLGLEFKPGTKKAIFSLIAPGCLSDRT